MCREGWEPERALWLLTTAKDAHFPGHWHGQLVAQGRKACNALLFSLQLRAREGGGSQSMEGVTRGMQPLE